MKAKHKKIHGTVDLCIRQVEKVYSLFLVDSIDTIQIPVQ